MPEITLPPMKENLDKEGESLKWLIEQVIPQLSFQIKRAKWDTIPFVYRECWNVWFQQTQTQTEWEIKVIHPDGKTTFTTYIVQNTSRPEPTPYDTLGTLIDDARMFRSRKNWQALADDLGHKTAQEKQSTRLSWEVMKVENRQVMSFFPDEVYGRFFAAELDL